MTSGKIQIFTSINQYDPKFYGYSCFVIMIFSIPNFYIVHEKRKNVEFEKNICVQGQIFNLHFSFWQNIYIITNIKQKQKTKKAL